MKQEYYLKMLKGNLHKIAVNLGESVSNSTKTMTHSIKAWKNNVVVV